MALVELAFLIAGVALSTRTVPQWFGRAAEYHPGAHRQLGAVSLCFVLLPLGQLLRRWRGWVGGVALIAAAGCLVLAITAG